MNLFKKYKRLLFWFTNTSFGKDYLSGRGVILPKQERVRLLPNGYISHKGFNYFQMVVTVDPYHMERKVGNALIALDTIHSFVSDFDQARMVFLWKLGLGSRSFIPQVIRSLHFNQSTFTPDVNDVDGRVGRDTGNENWATIRGSAGTKAQDANTAAPQINAHASGNTWDELHRRFCPASTAALTSSATLLGTSKIRPYVTSTNTGITQSMGVVNTTAPATLTGSITTDYAVANWPSTRQATDIAIGSLSTSAFNDYTFNATGLGNISKTGATRMGFMLSGDADNSEPTWGAGAVGGAIITAYNGANPTQYVIDFTLPGVDDYGYFM